MGTRCAGDAAVRVERVTRGCADAAVRVCGGCAGLDAGVQRCGDVGVRGWGGVDGKV